MKMEVGNQAEIQQEGESQEHLEEVEEEVMITTEKRVTRAIGKKEKDESVSVFWMKMENLYNFTSMKALVSSQ